MGPYPHDDVIALVSEANPVGTAGFEFIEFAHAAPERLSELFEQMGFRRVARHKSKQVFLYRQGAVNYLINAEKDCFAASFAKTHGPCACAMAWRVANAQAALDHAVANGAKAVQVPSHSGELELKGIEGIGGSHPTQPLKALDCITLITSPTMLCVGIWTHGPISTRGFLDFEKSGFLISKAGTLACFRVL